MAGGFRLNKNEKEMRKIEENMLQAIAARKNWRSGNTAVEVETSGAVSVWLHGNCIAVIDGQSKKFKTAGWATVTTASRLRALGANIRLHVADDWIEDLTTGQPLAVYSFD